MTSSKSPNSLADSNQAPGLLSVELLASLQKSSQPLWGGLRRLGMISALSLFWWLVALTKTPVFQLCFSSLLSSYFIFLSPFPCHFHLNRIYFILSAELLCAVPVPAALCPKVGAWQGRGGLSPLGHPELTWLPVCKAPWETQMKAAAVIFYSPYSLEDLVIACLFLFPFDLCSLLLLCFWQILLTGFQMKSAATALRARLLSPSFAGNTTVGAVAR